MKARANRVNVSSNKIETSFTFAEFLQHVGHENINPFYIVKESSKFEGVMNYSLVTQSGDPDVDGIFINISGNALEAIQKDYATAQEILMEDGSIYKHKKAKLVDKSPYLELTSHRLDLVIYKMRKESGDVEYKLGIKPTYNTIAVHRL